MRRNVKFSTILGLFLIVVLRPEVASSGESGTGYALPQFRSVQEQPGPDLPDKLPVKLVADADFAPYSFVSNSGSPAGLSVELAIAACERAGLDCTVVAKPFAEIMPALASGEADVAVTGPRLEERTLRGAGMTRPYFRVMARFAVGAASSLVTADATALSGYRLGVVKDTVHARWLAAYYGSSRITAFDSLSAAGEALKAAKVDAIFGDNLQVIYWVAGDAAAGCCRLLGGAYSDFDYFTRNLAFLVRQERPDIRQALDYGLDQAQASGATEKIIRTYVPLPPW